MKKIIKLSIVSLCATGAAVATQAHDQSASNTESDKNLVITEPAGSDNSDSRADSSYTGVTGWQGTYHGGQAYSGETYSSRSYGTPMAGQQIYESSGAQVGGPSMVTGRQQDCYADCILKQYQSGKGAARATDEHYFNNVSGDRMYAQYPASGGMYQNFAYSSYNSQASYGSAPMASTTIHSPRPAEGWSGSQGLWYAPDGRIYNAQGVQVSGQRSAGISEPAGSASFNSQSSQSSSYGAQQSSSAGVQAGAAGAAVGASTESSSGAQPSATQSGTSGDQSKAELKGQEQKGSATSEAAGAQANPSSSTESSAQPSSTSSSESSAQPSSTSTAPDQSSTQSSSTSTENQGMTEKVRSSLKSDSTLSPISSNVTVQDQNGKVALNGTVKSEAEKQQVVSKAEELAGSGNVIDNLQIQSDSNNSGSSNSSSSENNNSSSGNSSNPSNP